MMQPTAAADDDATADNYSETYNVEVYQPRDPRQFMEDDDRTPLDGREDLCDDLRDVRTGFIEADDLTFEDFGRLWTLAGTDQIDAADATTALHATFEQWNNGSGVESDAFVQANEEQRATSLSTGDLVRINGTAYLCESVGWTEMDW